VREAKGSKAAMDILAIETSSDIASVAVKKDGRTNAVSFDAVAALTETLPITVYRLLSETGVDPGRLGVIAVGSGPGSYTGLRVGMTFAAVTAWTLKARYCEVPSLLSLGLHALHSDASSHAVVATANAYRNEVYVRAIAQHADGTFDLGKDALIPAAELGEYVRGMVRSRHGTVTVLGFGCDILKARGGLPEGTLAAQSKIACGAEAVLTALELLGIDSFVADPLSVHPLYLRKSSAEIQRDSRQP
jgi:tRNA threonylcarbamoyladenosine biosynthesis protein TsaB